MTSSIPAAIDYLVTLAQQASAASGAVVSDGWPVSPAELMFAVGSDRPPQDDAGEAASGQSSLMTIGTPLVEEIYGVPCWIFSGAGGTDQAAVRNAAFALWDAFLPLLAADLSLGGALAGTASISDVRLEGPRTVDQAGAGRFALLLFTVNCPHAYNL